MWNSRGQCNKAISSLCSGCKFSCQCLTCSSGDRCDCSCRWLVILGLTLTLLASLTAFISWKENRRSLWFWSSTYAISSASMSYVTYKTGPDPHDPLGCTVPFSLWILCMFVTTLGYWTTGFIQQGQEMPQISERYVYGRPASKLCLLSRLNTQSRFPSSSSICRHLRSEPWLISQHGNFLSIHQHTALLACPCETICYVQVQAFWALRIHSGEEAGC